MDRNDIEITDIDIRDSFRYAGRVFHGLDELKMVAFKDSDKSVRMQKSPYVVIVSKHYPCFDSEDYANESRYYQNYYLTTSRAKAEQICEDYDKAEEYPVMEPKFSMSRIEEKHLPYIYYHGEGSTLQIVQNKHAELKDRITIEPSRHDSSFPNPFRDPDPIACLYGPPPDFEDEESTHKKGWLDFLLGK